jgi:hypothetical protein
MEMCRPSGLKLSPPNRPALAEPTPHPLVEPPQLDLAIRLQAGERQRYEQTNALLTPFLRSHIHTHPSA